MLGRKTTSLAWILALTLGVGTVAARAQEFRYRYVSIDEAALPQGVLFFDPVALNNSGRIYGTAFVCATSACESILPHVANYADGAVTIHRPGFVSVVNEGGTIGGSVLVDPENFIEQAALFRGDRVELIPPQPEEFTSFVIALNDSGSALVMSFDASFEPSIVLYKNGQATVLDFGPSVTNPSQLAINNQGVISGTQGNSFCDDFTGFRWNSRTGETTLLNPLATELAALGLDINSRGEVLGYSFVCSGLERIGVWDRHGEFQTYFVEGTPEFPTISNQLRFNDNNLIVITSVSSPDSESLRNSYLVPRPDTRLNLADLVQNIPPDLNLSNIRDINNHGSMIGADIFGGAFLLERIGAGDR
jgi:hypothetical protein